MKLILQHENHLSPPEINWISKRKNQKGFQVYDMHQSPRWIHALKYHSMKTLKKLWGTNWELEYISRTFPCTDEKLYTYIYTLYISSYMYTYVMYMCIIINIYTTFIYLPSNDFYTIVHTKAVYNIDLEILPQICL